LPGVAINEIHVATALAYGLAALESCAPSNAGMLSRISVRRNSAPQRELDVLGKTGILMREQRE
jgi:hypothetical protein